MSYLTLEEYKELGFAEIEEFSELKLKAEMAVDLYTNYFYQNNNLEDDFPQRKKAVKLATAEDKHSLGSLSIGRTTVNYGSSGSSPAKIEASKYNLALDTMNLLKSVGFGYRGVCYDR